MRSFNLKIVTPHGVHFDGQAEGITVRTVGGDMSIWSGHVDAVTALGIGKAGVTVDGERRYAACSGGVLSVIKGDVTVLASTFEWAEEIDLERAREDLAKGKEELAVATDEKSVQLAKQRITRALVREGVKTGEI